MWGHQVLERIDVDPLVVPRGQQAEQLRLRAAGAGHLHVEPELGDPRADLHVEVVTLASWPTTTRCWPIAPRLVAEQLQAAYRSARAHARPRGRRRRRTSPGRRPGS